MPEKITRWLGVARLLLFCLLIGAAAWRMWTLPAWLETQITREGNATRQATSSAIADTRRDVLKEVGHVRTDVMGRLDTAIGAANTQMTGLRGDLNRQSTDIASKADNQITGLRGDLNTRLTDISGKLDAQLTTANSTLDAQLTTANNSLNTQLLAANGSLSGIGVSLKPALDAAAGITTQVNEALPLWLDCEGNPSCAFNLYQGTAKSIEHTAQNFDRLTKPKWYDRLLGYGVNTAVLYRDLNPAASVVTLGTRLLSARP